MNYLFFDKALVYPSAKYGFAPSSKYPEYPFSVVATEDNKVYAAIRSMWQAMGLDAEHYGTAEWNPLGRYIKPGMKVVLKPNFVMHKNGSAHPDDLDSLVTHPSIIRCVLDYVYIALKGRGEVIVGDAPVKDCDFRLLMERREYTAIEDFFAGVDDFSVSFYDFRGPEEEGGQYADIGHGVRVNLGEHSWFYNSGHDESRLRIPNYDYRKVVSHHTGTTQEYMLNSTVLDADVIISLPKPKTHRKNGYTAALKNFVGANYSKEYLPHHTEGAVSEQGDEYVEDNMYNRLASRTRLHIDINRNRMDRLNKSGRIAARRICSLGQRIMGRVYGRLNRMALSRQQAAGKSLAHQMIEGSWYGNDTLWRTVLDLNYAVVYARPNGTLADTPQRTIIHLGDMVVAGHEEGPMAPTAKEQHMLLFGEDAVDFDAIVVRLMGFDYQRLRGLASAIGFAPLTSHGYDDIQLTSNVKAMTGNLAKIDFSGQVEPFTAAAGWRGAIELA